MAHFGALPQPPARLPVTKRVRPMRGLEERVAFALAKSLSITDQEEAANDMAAVLMDAEALGMQEQHQGITEAPIMFADEPLLLAAWKTGHAFGEELADSGNCPGCNDRERPPVPNSRLSGRSRLLRQTDSPDSAEIRGLLKEVFEMPKRGVCSNYLL
jgi:hypothetical protein